MKRDNVNQVSNLERASIDALSRPTVVEAYMTWDTVSDAEAICIDLAVKSGETVLDLGCGAGRLAGHVASKAKSYYGIDASQPMIMAARTKFPDLTFVVGDILQHQMDDSSVDVIFLAGNVLDFLHPHARRSSLLGRCFRWLRPGGSVVGSSHLSKRGQTADYYTEDYHGAPLHQFRSSASEMIAEVEGHGFEVSLFARDYRKYPAEWANWVAEKPRNSSIL